MRGAGRDMLTDSALYLLPAPNFFGLVVPSPLGGFGQRMQLPSSMRSTLSGPHRKLGSSSSREPKTLRDHISFAHQCQPDRALTVSST